MSIFAQAQIESTKAKLRDLNYDQEGLEIEFDVREDDEQGLKETQIVDLFVAAGYFRARIKGLSSFDKIVGGMVWCISLSNYEVDVDLLFQENSSIGMKISLTEKIVYLLPIMHCPHRLEPHQIQGLDCIHIFPVVQWLVRKAIETRNDLGNTIRTFSVFNFCKEFSLVNDATSFNAVSVIENLSSLENHVLPRRKFRNSNTSFEHDRDSTKILMTLLEYGHSIDTSTFSNNAVLQSGRKSKSSNILDLPASTFINNLAELLQDMSEVTNEDLSSNKLGNIVSLQADSISQFSQVYQSLKEEQPRIVSQTNLRLIASLEKQYHIQKKSLSSLNSNYCDIRGILDSERNSLSMAILEGSQFVSSLEYINISEANIEDALFERVTELITFHDQLKKQEKMFKQHNQEDCIRLSSLIESLRSSGKQTTDAVNVELEKISEQKNMNEQKYLKIRNMLAKKTREISSFQRKIDDIPSRAELAQYQRRFVELNKLVSATLTETRQYFTLYNTLNDTQIFLNKELQLLNLLYEKFDTALTSHNNKEIYIKHLFQFLGETLSNLE